MDRIEALYLKGKVVCGLKNMYIIYGICIHFLQDALILNSVLMSSFSGFEIKNATIQLLTWTNAYKNSVLKDKNSERNFFKPWMVVEKEKQFLPPPFLLFNMLIRGTAPRNPDHETSSSENDWQSFCALIITSLLLSWADVDLCKWCYS